jgi:membrane protein implicated in regulation of membrane protease activity
MDWWLWILLGLALLGVEMVTPGGFYVLFFGAGALVVGTLVALGAGGSVAVQWLLFSLGSIGALVFFRQRLLALFKSSESGREVDSLRQDVAILLDALPPNGVGRAELRGTTWTVRNGGAQALPAGQRCRVERVEGLTLWVSPE